MLKVITAAAVVVIAATACSTTPEPSTSVDHLHSPKDSAYMSHLAAAGILPPHLTSVDESDTVTLGREYCDLLDDVDPRAHANVAEYLVDESQDRVFARAVVAAAEYAYCPEWS